MTHPTGDSLKEELNAAREGNEPTNAEIRKARAAGQKAVPDKPVNDADASNEAARADLRLALKDERSITDSWWVTLADDTFTSFAEVRSGSGEADEALEAAGFLDAEAFGNELIRRWNNFRALEEKNRALVEALADVGELIDDYVDVEDGDYGEPNPNKAMKAQTIINDAIAKAQP